WLASLGYLLVTGIVLVLVWKKYKNKDEKEKLPFTWKDFGIALLFYLATRLVAIGGTFLIQMVTGNATSANDAALMA
ncbi:CPBP family intramembrane glutamic endopeptidase, partial [Streptococcus pyogenes]